MSQPIGYTWDGALYCTDCIGPIVAAAAGFEYNPERNGWWVIRRAVDADPDFGDGRLGEVQLWTMDYGPEPCAKCAVPIGRGVAERVAELVAELPCEECGAEPGEECNTAVCTGWADRNK